MIFTRLLTLLNGKKVEVDVSDVLLLKKNVFTIDEDLFIPTDQTLILNCPTIDGDITVDGEEYIL